MERPPSDKFSIDQLLQLRQISSDTFYSIIRKLTNEQLNDLCRQDTKYNFCGDKVFWEKLWYISNNTTPPQFKTVKRMRQAYEESNLLESLVEEIYLDKQLGRDLHQSVVIKDLPRDSEYYNVINDESDFDEEMDKKLKEFDRFIEASFQENWSRDLVRQILTKMTEVKDDDNEEDDEDIRIEKRLYYDKAILHFALKTRNEELLRYFLLTLNHIDVHRLVRLFNTYDSQITKLIDRVLLKIKPFGRLNFVKNATIEEIIKFATDNGRCNGELLSGYFSAHRDDLNKILKVIFSGFFLEKIIDCPAVRDVYINAILSLPEKDKEKIKNLYLGTPLELDLLEENEVEQILITSKKREVLEKLLMNWQIDRADLLRQLMEENRWQPFKRILIAIGELEEEYNEQNQKDLYQLYLDFLALRKQRKKDGIFIWEPLRISKNDEYNMETLFLLSFKGKYLLKALKKSLSDDNFPVDFLETLVGSAAFTELSKRKINELVEEISPEKGEEFHELLIRLWE